MKKPKHKYNVYIVGVGHGCYRQDYEKSFVGATFAVSEKQACNNVRYGYKSNGCPNGGYSEWTVGDYMDEGWISYSYKAEMA